MKSGRKSRAFFLEHFAIGLPNDCFLKFPMLKLFSDYAHWDILTIVQTCPLRTIYI